MPTLPKLVALLVVIPALPALAPSGARAADVESKPTATVTPVALPAKKAGGRDARYALGKKTAAETARRPVEEMLSLTSAFSEILPEGGEIELALSLERCELFYEDMGHFASRLNPVNVTCQGTFAWSQASDVVHEGELDVTGGVETEGPPRRADYRDAWFDMLRVAGRTAALSAFEAGAIGDGSIGTEWLQLEQPQ